MLLGPDPGAAELVAAATARVRRRGGEVGADDEVPWDSSVTAEVARLFLAGRVPEGASPAPQPDLTDRQQLLDARFRALTRRQRVLLARRLTEGLTVAELAGLVDVSTKAVEQDLTSGGAELPELELATLLQAYAAAAPDDQAIRRASQRQAAAASRRRRRVTVLLGSALVLVLLLATAPAIVVPRLAGTARPLGTWNTYLQLRLPSDWELSYRSISPAVESARVHQQRPDGTAQDCDVILGSAGAPEQSDAPTAAEGESDGVRVHWRPGFYQDEVGLYSESLTWEYARDALASVSCENLTDRKLLYEIASSWVRIERSGSQPVPLSFEDLPERYQVETLFLAENPATSSEPPKPAFGVGSNSPDAWSMTVSVEPQLPQTASGSLVESPKPLAGRAVFVNSTQDGSVACLAAEQYVCVSAWWAGQSDWPSGAQGPSGVVLDTLAAVTVADRLTDRSTWFEADRALG